MPPGNQEVDARSQRRHASCALCMHCHSRRLPRSSPPAAWSVVPPEAAAVSDDDEPYTLLRPGAAGDALPPDCMPRKVLLLPDFEPCLDSSPNRLLNEGRSSSSWATTTTCSQVMQMGAAAGARSKEQQCTCVRACVCMRAYPDQPTQHPHLLCQVLP
jgi:hypothetical protein